MNKILRTILKTLAAVIPGCYGIAASAADYTSTVTVKSDNPDAGLVCITHAETSYRLISYKHTQPADPADDEYAAEVSTWYTSAGGGSKCEQRYYLYAKAKPGYKFVRWEGGPASGPVNSTEANYTYTWTHFTKGTTPPGITSTVTAYFVADNDVATETNIPAGVITLDPEAPKVGDPVTATITDNRIVQGGTIGNKNMMCRFSHWEDDLGNRLSSDESFSFTVERPMKLKAVYNNLGEVPRKGRYYRIRNVFNRVLTLEGGYKYNVTGAVDVPHALLRWALPLDHDYTEFWTGTANNEWEVSDAYELICPEASPNTIFYIADGATTDTQLTKGVLSSQDVDTKTLTGQNLDIVPMSDNFCGYYGLRASSLAGAGFKTVVRDRDAFVNISSFSESDVFAALAVQPVDEEHIDLFWFGAAPDESMQFDGGYWTSMFTAFPYECRDGVEAYFVMETADANGQSYACLTKVESGRVPANSAVLLKCTGLETKGNRLMPLDPATEIEPLDGNALQGAFQLYTNAQKEGRVKFDESNMRVLGVNSKGEVGFFKLAAADQGATRELKANKAYLDMRLLPGVAAASSFKLRIGNGDNVAIEFVEADMDAVRFDDMPAYDLHGRPASNSAIGNIYIINGRKVLAR